MKSNITFQPSSSRNFYKLIQWDITHGCNLRCLHCRSTEFYSQQRIRDLPLDANKRVADELYLNGVRRIHFLGGEPLLYKYFCKLVEYIQSLGIDWSVNTNATLLTPKIASRLLKAGARVITVSLDGPDSKTNDAIRGAGVFESVCKNVVSLTRLRNTERMPTKVVIACTLFRQDLGRLGEMADLTRRLGADSLILSSLRAMGRARKLEKDVQIDPVSNLDIATEIARYAKAGNSQHVQLAFLTPIQIQWINEQFGTDFPIYESGCNALKQKGYIQPDGALFPCQSLTNVAKTPACIGAVPRNSLHDKTFQSIWLSPEMRRIENALFSKKAETGMLPCRYCRYFRLVCYPCPLGPLAGKPSINIGCLTAMARLAALRGHATQWNALFEQIGLGSPIAQRGGQKCNLPEDKS